MSNKRIGEHHAIFSTGDAMWLAEMQPVDSPKGVAALLDLYEEYGITRVYWRGLQMELWNEVMEVTEEAVQYVGCIESCRKQYADFKRRYGMSMDAYFVKEAHKRGMEVWAWSTLQDWGSAPDVPINFWPAHYNASFRVAHPEWVPKDKHGYIEQGGAVDFAYPEARRTLIDLHMDKIRTEDYDGIVFITYSENFSIIYNDQFGFSGPAVEEFKRRYGITPGKDPFNRTASIYDWRRLRGEYLTQFLREMKAELGERGLGLVLDPRDPHHTQAWSVPTSINRNALYLDLTTYVAESLVDQFLVNGYSTVDIQKSVVKEMAFLARDTDTEVSILTSGPCAPHWADLQERGIATAVSSGAFGEEYFPVREAVVRENEWTAVNTRLSRIAMGEETADAAEITPYLTDTVPFRTLRLTIKAIQKIAPENGAEFLNPLILHEEPGIRGLAAIAVRRVCNADSVKLLLQAVDRYDEWAMREASSATLGVNNAKFAKLLMEGYETSENPLVRAVAMRALSYGAHPEYLDAFVKAVQTECTPANSTPLMRNYYNAIRYFAAQAIAKINSDAAVDALIEITRGGDTTACNRAVIGLGEMAKSGFSAAVARAEDIAAALAALLEQMGDGSTRADRAWAYRPIGEALLRLGDPGRAVLEKNLARTDDNTLALMAWKSLYIPYKVQGYLEMTEKEYDAAYEKMPAHLRNF